MRSGRLERADCSQDCECFERAHLDSGTKFGMISLLGLIYDFRRVALDWILEGAVQTSS